MQMAKKQRTDSKKSQKKSTKQEFKKIITDKLTAALHDLQDHWSKTKFESRIKKAVKLFSDGKPPRKKAAKKKSTENTAPDAAVQG
jgi:hypothetical protein